MGIDREKPTEAEKKRVLDSDYSDDDNDSFIIFNSHPSIRGSIPFPTSGFHYNAIRIRSITMKLISIFSLLLRYSRWITWTFKGVHAANLYDCHRYFVSRLPMLTNSTFTSHSFDFKFFHFIDSSLPSLLFCYSLEPMNLSSFVPTLFRHFLQLSLVCSRIHFRYRRYR